MVPQRFVQAVADAAGGQRGKQWRGPRRSVLGALEAEPCAVQPEQLVDERVRQQLDRAAGQQLLDHEEATGRVDDVLARHGPSGVFAQPVGEADCAPPQHL